MDARGERTLVNALTASMAGAGGGADDNTAQGGHLVAATLTQRHGKGPGSDLPDGHDVPVGVDLAQITSSENRSNPQPGDPQPPLATTGRPHVAYALRRDPGGAGQGHNITYVPMALGGQGMRDLTAEGADASEDGTGRGTPIIGFSEHGNSGTSAEDLSPAVRTGTGGSATSVVAAAVRRLTPTECERLQGYPDGWTATSYGREQADSPRYRQLGNSIAVPVFEWVARRIVAVEERP